jgi:hypothetical protein
MTLIPRQRIIFYKGSNGRLDPRLLAKENSRKLGAMRPSVVNGGLI